MKIYCTDGCADFGKALWCANFNTPYPTSCVYSVGVVDAVSDLISGNEVRADPLPVVNFCLQYSIKSTAGRGLYSYFKQHCSKLPSLINHMYAIGKVLSTARTHELAMEAFEVIPDVIINDLGLSYLVEMTREGLTDDDRVIEIIDAAKLDGTACVMMDIVRQSHIDVRRAVYRKVKDRIASQADMKSVCEFTSDLEVSLAVTVNPS